MIILGLTAPISWNTAACILVDGELVAFVEEERFRGIKHAPRMVPEKSINYCLRQAGVSMKQVDYVAYGFESVWHGLFLNITKNLKEGNIKRGIREVGAFAEYFLQMQRTMDFFKNVHGLSQKEIKSKSIFMAHHLAHAASTALASGFDQTNIISIDGVGENESGWLAYMQEGKIRKLRSIGINQSLGALYHTVTYCCGFTPHSHEGKVMGLAPYGKPDFSMFEGIAEITTNGYYLHKNFASKLEQRFGRRGPDQEIKEIHKNLAATVQAFLEEAALKLCAEIHAKTGYRNLCLAGGVALNCDMNTKLKNSGLVDEIYIVPAANDAGCALGAAMQVYIDKTGNSPKKITHALWGPQYSDEDIETLLQEAKLTYRRYKDLAEIAAYINEGKIVGWFQDRIEMGPRALGARSILAHPAFPGIKDKINKEVKHREVWRPFAPSVLDEFGKEYFTDYYYSPFMLMTFTAIPEKREKIKAVLHVDNTARVQSVRKEDVPRYYELIYEFYKLSGVPMVLDTSFNDKEKPISLTPRDAIQAFFSTGMDILVLGSFILEKDKGK